MSDPDYSETVTLYMLYEDAKTLSLADAVRAVIYIEDRAKKLSAWNPVRANRRAEAAAAATGR
jgi:hypothetical protein